MKRKSAKRAMSMALAAALAFTPMTAMAATDTKGHWAEKTITTWEDAGLLKGYSDGSVKPDNKITRAEFVTMMNKALKNEAVGTIAFADVKEGDWFHGAVAAAVGAGYTKGYPDGSFKPNATITRAEAAVMIANAAGLKADEAAANKFTDAAAIPVWAKGSVGAAVAAGYMSGYPDGSFGASKTITRAESISTLNRAMKKGSDVKVEDVVVTKDDTVIENQTIEGNLIIDKAVGDGEVYVKNTKIKGNVVVQGGGDDSIYLTDTSVDGKIILDKAAVRLQVSGKTKADTVEVKQYANIAAKDFAGKIGTITITNDVKDAKAVIVAVPADKVVVDSKANVVVKAEVATVEMTKKAEDVTLEVAKGAEVSAVVADSKIKLSGEGKVKKLEANANGIQVDKNLKVEKTETAKDVKKPVVSNVSKPSTSGGGGGGGSSSKSDSTSNKTKLKDEIKKAQALLDATVESANGADVTADKYWAPAAAKTTLSKAIKDAQKVADKGSNSEYKKETDKLKKAVAEFNKVRKEGTVVTKEMMNAVLAKVEAAKLNVTVAQNADKATVEAAIAAEAQKAITEKGYTVTFAVTGNVATDAVGTKNVAGKFTIKNDKATSKTVTSKTDKTISITVKSKEQLSDNVSVKKITVAGVDASSTDQTAYTVKVPAEKWGSVTKDSVGVTLDDANAKAVVADAEGSTETVKKFTVTVTAENGKNTATYQVTATKEEEAVPDKEITDFKALTPLVIKENQKLFTEARVAAKLKAEYSTVTVIAEEGGKQTEATATVTEWKAQGTYDPNNTTKVQKFVATITMPKGFKDDKPTPITVDVKLEQAQTQGQLSDNIEVTSPDGKYMIIQAPMGGRIFSQKENITEQTTVTQFMGNLTKPAGSEMKVVTNAQADTITNQATFEAATGKAAEAKLAVNDKLVVLSESKKVVGTYEINVKTQVVEEATITSNVYAVDQDKKIIAAKPDGPKITTTTNGTDFKNNLTITGYAVVLSKEDRGMADALVDKGVEEIKANWSKLKDKDKAKASVAKKMAAEDVVVLAANDFSKVILYTVKVTGGVPSPTVPVIESSNITGGEFEKGKATGPATISITGKNFAENTEVFGSYAFDNDQELNPELISGLESLSQKATIDVAKQTATYTINQDKLNAMKQDCVMYAKIGAKGEWQKLTAKVHLTDPSEPEAIKGVAITNEGKKVTKGSDITLTVSGKLGEKTYVAVKKVGKSGAAEGNALGAVKAVAGVGATKIATTDLEAAADIGTKYQVVYSNDYTADVSTATWKEASGEIVIVTEKVAPTVDSGTITEKGLFAQGTEKAINITINGTNLTDAVKVGLSTETSDSLNDASTIKGNVAVALHDSGTVKATAEIEAKTVKALEAGTYNLFYSVDGGTKWMKLDTDTIDIVKVASGTVTADGDAVTAGTAKDITISLTGVNLKNTVKVGLSTENGDTLSDASKVKQSTVVITDGTSATATLTEAIAEAGTYNLFYSLDNGTTWIKVASASIEVQVGVGA